MISCPERHPSTIDAMSNQDNKITVHDVKLGRGGGPSSYSGNIFYRTLCKSSALQYYHASDPVDKKIIAGKSRHQPSNLPRQQAVYRRYPLSLPPLSLPLPLHSIHITLSHTSTTVKIVEQIRYNGGRFIELSDGVWKDIGHFRAIKKTAQCLREGQAEFLRQTGQHRATVPSVLHSVPNRNDVVEPVEKAPGERAPVTPLVMGVAMEDTLVLNVPIPGDNLIEEQAALREASAGFPSVEAGQHTATRTELFVATPFAPNPSAMDVVPSFVEAGNAEVQIEPACTNEQSPQQLFEFERMVTPLPHESHRDVDYLSRVGPPLPDHIQDILNRPSDDGDDCDDDVNEVRSEWNL